MGWGRDGNGRVAKGDGGRGRGWGWQKWVQ